MANMARFDAVIFDLDGLVLDTEPAYRLAWQRAAADLGLALEEPFFRQLSGLEGADVESALLASAGADFALERFRALSADHWQRHVEAHGIAVKPGVAELLAHLRRAAVPHALATNSPGRYAALCLQLAGLDGAFPLLVSRDDVARAKPEPDLFLEAASRLGVRPCLCLALEDSVIGLRAARRAGMTAVLVSDDEVARRAAGPKVPTLPSLLQVPEAFFAQHAGRPAGGGQP